MSAPPARLALALALVACPSQEGPSGSPQEVCGQYLDCVQETSPSLVGELLDAYGTDGDCWTSAENEQRCAEACAAGLEDLHDTYSHAAACRPADWVGVLEEGAWELELAASGGVCGMVGDAVVEESWVSNVRADHFTLTMYLGAYGSTLPVILECARDAFSFACDPAGVAGHTFHLDGEFAANYLALDGTMAVYQGDCEGTVVVTGEPVY